jgi:hypothetical protein
VSSSTAEEAGRSARNRRSGRGNAFVESSQDEGSEDLGMRTLSRDEDEEPPCVSARLARQ